MFVKLALWVKINFSFHWSLPLFFFSFFLFNNESVSYMMCTQYFSEKKKKKRLWLLYPSENFGIFIVIIDSYNNKGNRF